VCGAQSTRCQSFRSSQRHSQWGLTTPTASGLEARADAASERRRYTVDRSTLEGARRLDGEVAPSGRSVGPH